MLLNNFFRGTGVDAIDYHCWAEIRLLVHSEDFGAAREFRVLDCDGLALLGAESERHGHVPRFLEYVLYDCLACRRGM